MANITAPTPPDVKRDPNEPSDGTDTRRDDAPVSAVAAVAVAEAVGGPMTAVVGASSGPVDPSATPEPCTPEPTTAVLVAGDDADDEAPAPNPGRRAP